MRSIPDPLEVGCGASLPYPSIPDPPEVGCGASLTHPRLGAEHPCPTRGCRGSCSVASATFSGAPAQRSFQVLNLRFARGKPAALRLGAMLKVSLACVSGGLLGVNSILACSESPRSRAFRAATFRAEPWSLEVLSAKLSGEPAALRLGAALLPRVALAKLAPKICSWGILLPSG